MKTIEYKVVYNHQAYGSRDVIIAVEAKDINTGFGKAVKEAQKRVVGDELHSIEFWQVR